MIYDLIAPFYDRENADVDYTSWADFFEEIFKRRMSSRPELILDLGCGTGSMTLELARRGYDMTGVDYASEMLDIARQRAEEESLSDTCLWLCQDMCDLDLYGTVDVCVSCLDTVNHLTAKKDLSRVFSLVHNFLNPDGLFIFDINTKHKFESRYASEVYTYDSDGAYLVWENDYRQKSGLCDFYITLFKEEADGRYVRYDEVQTERAYSIKTIIKTLAENGFADISVYSDFDFHAGSESDERVFFVARANKEGVNINE